MDSLPVCDSQIAPVNSLPYQQAVREECVHERVHVCVCVVCVCAVYYSVCACLFANAVYVYRGSKTPGSVSCTEA